MATSWKTLRAPLVDTPEKAAARKAAVEKLNDEYEAYQRTLAELRKARQLTQAQLADELGLAQSEISRVERREDLYLSTLARFVGALGGRLELRVTFDDDATPTVLQLGDLTDRGHEVEDAKLAA
ncbi:MAG: XRE family transcriptional regulator [Patulibacter sp.]